MTYKRIFRTSNSVVIETTIPFDTVLGGTVENSTLHHSTVQHSMELGSYTQSKFRDNKNQFY